MFFQFSLQFCMKSILLQKHFDIYMTDENKYGWGRRREVGIREACRGGEGTRGKGEMDWGRVNISSLFGFDC